MIESQDDPITRWEQGDRVRRAVLGDAYVDGARKSAFAEPLQQLVTEFCWGGPWSRPGLPRTTRSLLNLAILTALNRPHELRLHTHGALRNRCTVDEISEVLLQATVYAGIPAGVDAFKTVEKAIDEYLLAQNGSEQPDDAPTPDN